MNNIKLLLKQFLKTLERNKKNFGPGLDDTKRADIAIDFQSKVINILDYCYTNFPVERKELGQYFPRSEISEDKQDYLNRIKLSKKNRQNPDQSVEHSIKINRFLEKCFEINKANNFAISLILSKTKHETENKFGDKGKTKLTAKFKTNHPEPIKQKSDGSIEIAGGFIKAEAGATLQFYGTKICTPEGDVEFDELNFSGTKFEGNYIYLKNNEKRDFLTWANDCENICSQIIDEFNKINEP